MEDDTPTHWELMRAIKSLDTSINSKISALSDSIDERITPIENCMWGEKRDDGLVRMVHKHSSRISLLERIVFGIVTAGVTILLSLIICFVKGMM